MMLDYKNTKYDLKISVTNNDIGLTNNDVWCNVDITVKNNEFKYHVNRQSFSKNELTKIVNNLKTSYYKNEKPPKLYFIKNYFTIDCYFKENNKYMNLNLINPENTNFKNYTITFKNTEILDFLNIIESPIV